MTAQSFCINTDIPDERERKNLIDLCDIYIILHLIYPQTTAVHGQK